MWNEIAQPGATSAARCLGGLCLQYAFTLTATQSVAALPNSRPRLREFTVQLRSTSPPTAPPPHRASRGKRGGSFTSLCEIPVLKVSPLTVKLFPRASKTPTTRAANAAYAYFGACRNIPVLWPKADLQRIPEHWRTVGSRQSPLSGGPRLAITPVHAILNYCFALLESETRLALAALGLDRILGSVPRSQGHDS